MLDLTQVHLAEKEDKEQQLDRWAKLFYASTWEEFKMISAENKNTVIEELKSLNEKNNMIIDELKSSNKEKDALIVSLQAQIAGSQKL